MRIAVTGGAGFIGSHLVDSYISAGHEVLVIDNLSTGKAQNLNPKALFSNADIRDAAAVDRAFAQFHPEIVNHHAAQIDIRRSVDDPAFDATVNVVGSIVLLQQAVRHGARGFIFASSGGAIYGETPEPAPETAVKAPISPYGAAKAAVEYYMFVSRRTFGLPAVALRYGNVYGPRQDPKGEAGVVSIFAGALLSGAAPTIFGTGEQVRDYVYVGDVVNANLRVIDYLLAGPPVPRTPDDQAFNIGSGVSTSVNELYRMLAGIVGFAGDPVYGDPRPGELMESRLDISRARTVLGFSPETDFEQGMRKVVDWLSR